MKKIITLIILCTLLGSCAKTPDFPSPNYKLGGGVLILNEGNFMVGNGSLSFYSYDSSRIYNNVFYSVNGRPLGDVPNSLIVYNGMAYIVVNNSGKIEVVDPVSIESKATISKLVSPRHMAIVNSTKAYVTSLYSDSLTIIDLALNSVAGYINLRRSSEAIVLAGIKAYVSNWMGGHEIMVINTLNNKVIDSIAVGNEPESMAFDKNGLLWVLCNGGWKRENFAELDAIDITTDRVSKNYVFSTKEESPTCLKIDPFGQTLYYLDNGVRKMDINLGELPPTAIIPQDGASFYKIAINPGNGNIFVTDAVDYSQPGFVLIYKNDGTFVAKVKAEIIPSSMAFRLIVN